MGRFIDITGERYGRLVVLNFAGLLSGRTSWLCKCDCGNEVITSSNSLRRGRTQSCGCIRKEKASCQSKIAGNIRGQQLIKHGLCNERIYKVWKGMRNRCNNPNNKFYKDYGGRGIRLCSEWDDFETFYKWAMQNGYNPDANYGECTIDRVDVNGNYEPSNCRFVNSIIQANNRRKRKI